MSDPQIYPSAQELTAQPQLDACAKSPTWPCVMVDIETLGTADDAVILEIGAVCFDREGGRLGAEWNMVVDHVLQSGRRIDPETLQWWLAPERAASLAAMTTGSGTKPLLWHALGEMAVYLGKNLVEGGEVWAKGNFDLRILGHAYAAEGQSVPWKYFQARELRTVLKLARVTVPKVETAHRALADARRQVEQLWEAQMLLAEEKWDAANWQAGWEEYRRELATTQAMMIPAWNHLSEDTREAWCAGVRAVFGNFTAHSP